MLANKNVMTRLLQSYKKIKYKLLLLKLSIKGLNTKGNIMKQLLITLTVLLSMIASAKNLSDTTGISVVNNSNLEIKVSAIDGELLMSSSYVSFKDKKYIY